MARVVCAVFLLLVALVSASVGSVDVRAEGQNAQRPKLLAAEKKNPTTFWKAATPQQVALLVGNTKLTDWPIFDLGAGRKGYSRVHLAARWGRHEMVELLLSNGADIHARDKDCETPLHHAAFRGQRKVAELLLANGADIHARTKDDKTAEDMAKGKGHEELVDFLAQQK